MRIAIAAILRNEFLSVPEWVTFHRLQGVTDFRIYDNGSDDGTVEALHDLGISPISWPDRPADFDVQQRAAYEDALTALTGVADFVALIDADEFLLGTKTLAASLANVPADIGAIAVQQRVFGSSGHVAAGDGLVIERFVRCAAPGHRSRHWFKTIARPEAVATVDTVHSVVLRTGRYAHPDLSPLRQSADHPGFALDARDGPIVLHHYAIKSRAEFTAKQARWTGRNQGQRMTEEYFAVRDTFANEVECREALPWATPVRTALRAQNG